MSKSCWSCAAAVKLSKLDGGNKIINAQTTARMSTLNSAIVTMALARPLASISVAVPIRRSGECALGSIALAESRD